MHQVEHDAPRDQEAARGENPEQTSAPEDEPTTARGRRLAHLTLVALIVLPIAIAMFEALRAPKLNFYDYWLVLGRTTTSDGALHISALFDLYNDHPILMVGIVFWLDAKWFDGTNLPLSLLTILLAGAILVSLWRMLPTRLRGTRRLGTVAALSTLVFSSAATEYFGVGMMGVQWFLGLAPAVVALAFAHHGRTIPAVIAAAIASLGHGIAFPVWIGLAVVAWLRRDRLWRLLTPVVLGLGVGTVWILTPGGDSQPPTSIRGVDSYLGSLLTTLGHAWSGDEVGIALIAGAVTLGLLGIFLAGAARERLGHTGPHGPERAAADSGWFGLATHIVLAAGTIGLSRGGQSNAEALVPRYAAIGLLAIAVLLVLVILRGPGRVRTHAVATSLIVALVTYGLGSTAAADTRAKYPNHEVLGVAMRSGATSTTYDMHGYPDYLEHYRALSVYPFTDDFTLGCGGPELGSRLDTADVVDMPGPAPNRRTAGATDSVTDTLSEGKPMDGWAIIGGEQADCVLIVDSGGTVVGGGAVGIPREDIPRFTQATGRAGWQATANPDVDDPTVVVGHNGTFYRIADS